MIPWTCSHCGGPGACTGCTRCGRYGATLDTIVPVTSPQGVGLQDGRGYGPYGNGYWRVSHKHGGGSRQEVGHGWLPLGPRGERLGPEYDFQPGPDDSYLPHRPPQNVLRGPDTATSVGRGVQFLAGLAVLAGVVWAASFFVRSAKK